VLGSNLPIARRIGPRGAACARYPGRDTDMATVLWILAVILVVAGILAILRKQLLWGIVLIVVGLLVGPGGVSIFHWA
jgi:hypothetical protein